MQNLAQDVSRQPGNGLTGVYGWRRRLLPLLVLMAMGQVHAEPASNALPVGESLVSGSASFNRTISNRLIINQSSDKLITNWDGFDMGSDARVSFIQPNSTSIALNRVTSASPTQIFGALNANGQVFIVNPNGIMFGAGSRVRVGGLVASALQIADDVFNSQNPVFKYDAAGVTANGAVENHGTIVSNAGQVLLLASSINNSGRIKVAGADVVMSNAHAVYTVPGQFQIIQDSIREGSIRNSGIIQAVQLGSVGGKVLLMGDTSQGSSFIALESGRFIVDDAIAVTGKTIQVGNFASTGNVRLEAGEIHFQGAFNFQGENSQLDIRGMYQLTDNAKINLNAEQAQLAINGNNFTIIRSLEDLQRLNDSFQLSCRCVLGSDVDASATRLWNNGAGFQPIGSAATPFSGLFDGFGHTVKNLRINRPSENVGLFAYTEGAVLRNLNLLNVRFNGFSAAGLVYSAKDTRLQHNSVTGNVNAKIRIYDSSVSSRTSLAGGLVGINNFGWVIDNDVNVRVNSAGHSNPAWFSTAGIAAGLVALNNGMVAQNTVAGTVAGQYKVGGLIGENTSSVYHNMSSADVFVTKPLNLASPHGLVDLLVGHDTADTLNNNVSTGTLTIK